MKKIASLLVGLVLAATSVGQTAPPISKSQLQSMFDSMRRDAPWNVDGPLLWGYFFTNKTPEPLRRAGEQLEVMGYRVVDLSERADAAASARWWLHVEKIETHTVESLHARNQELHALASKMSLNSYDGMDVGPVP
ncbi:hypothetical protein HNQ60_001200 [Povalibacter uvarum]|uniref:Regulator of ribonuclease activity B domain-containing protein n=1 Tax=Povalibacter uvarum TaxID=732238 RepID=A0A841HIF0_9GAMM|nr:ribonuclease E inhibitor RraB [Povalibacter uvarum]MBB6092354.1 hypothetical protein [Povalibacter uvarum]